MRKLMTGAVLAAAMATSTIAKADALTDEFAGSFKLETWLTNLPDITGVRFLPDGRSFVLGKAGSLTLVKNDGTTVEAFRFSVDTESEKGLLGVAIQPDFASSNRIVVYWSRSDSSGGSDQKRHRVSSFELKGDTLDPASEHILLDNLEGPANHDGGALSFGPDGYLYIGTGDCGCNETIPALPTLHQNRRATAWNSLNGKVLRIKVDGTIPSDNPYVGLAGPVYGITTPYTCGHADSMSSVNVPPSPEIYALGFRNAFRIWADPVSNNIWVGDVGEIGWEEVNVITPALKGRHFGWPFIEGPLKEGGATPSICDTLQPKPGECVAPAYTCAHGGDTTVNGVTYDGACQSITGGVIVDACQFPDGFRGRYYFADNVKGTIYSLNVKGDRSGVDPKSRQLVARLDSGGYPVELTEGPDGSLYVAIYGYGAPSRIVRLVPTTPNTCPAGTADAGPTIPPTVDAGGHDFSDNDGRRGCSCTTATSTQPGNVPLAAGLALLGAFIARKRKNWFRVRG